MHKEQRHILFVKVAVGVHLPTHARLSEIMITIN